MEREELLRFIGKENDTIVDAMQKIDRNAAGVLFITDPQDVLVGALSDGDIRRWLIRTGELQGYVKDAMNRNPISLFEGEDYQALRLIREKEITAVPVVDTDQKIVNIVFGKQEEDNSSVNSEALKFVPVVIMAGGMGTRLYPYTRILPKPLIPVGDKPIAEIIIDSFKHYGCRDYRLILNYKGSMIKAYFNDGEHDYDVSYVDEKKPLGTGGGVRLLKGQIGSTFILTNCDILVKADYSDILDYHRQEKNLVTMVCSLKNFHIPYGVVHMGNGGDIESMEEKPSFSFLTNTGLYIVEPEVIDMIPEDTEIGFPNVIEKLKGQGKKVGIYPVSENSWMDMGQMDTLEDMRQRLEGSLKQGKEASI